MLTWTKRVETQRAQTAVISSLHEAKPLVQFYKKTSGTQTKDQQKYFQHVHTADKNTNLDNTQRFGSINIDNREVG